MYNKISKFDIYYYAVIKTIYVDIKLNYVKVKKINNAFKIVFDSTKSGFLYIFRVLNFITILFSLHGIYF